LETLYLSTAERKVHTIATMLLCTNAYFTYCDTLGQKPYMHIVKVAYHCYDVVAYFTYCDYIIGCFGTKPYLLRATECYALPMVKAIAFNNKETLTLITWLCSLRATYKTVNLIRVLLLLEGRGISAMLRKRMLEEDQIWRINKTWCCYLLRHVMALRLQVHIHGLSICVWPLEESLYCCI